MELTGLNKPLQNMILELLLILSQIQGLRPSNCLALHLKPSPGAWESSPGSTVLCVLNTAFGSKAVYSALKDTNSHLFGNRCFNAQHEVN